MFIPTYQNDAALPPCNPFDGSAGAHQTALAAVNSPITGNFGDQLRICAANDGSVLPGWTTPKQSSDSFQFVKYLGIGTPPTCASATADSGRLGLAGNIGTADPLTWCGPDLTVGYAALGDSAGNATRHATDSVTPADLDDGSDTPSVDDCVKIATTSGEGTFKYETCGGAADVPITVLKTSDEAITNDATLSDDAALVFGSSAFAAETEYLIEGAWEHTMNAAGDFQFAFNGADVDAFRVVVLCHRSGSTSVQFYAAVTDAAGGANAITGSTDTWRCTFSGYLSTDASILDNFNFMWAQNTSDGNATTVHAGAWMRLTLP